MSEISFQLDIRKLIDFKEEAVRRLGALAEMPEEDVVFRKNPDGSILCHVNYKSYDISVRLEAEEVFAYALQHKKAIIDTIHILLKEKICKELLRL